MKHFCSNNQCHVLGNNPNLVLELQTAFHWENNSHALNETASGTKFLKVRPVLPLKA